MEKIIYRITGNNDESYTTESILEARKAFREGKAVVEYKTFTTYTENSVISLSITTELTTM